MRANVEQTGTTATTYPEIKYEQANTNDFEHELEYLNLCDLRTNKYFFYEFYRIGIQTRHQTDEHKENKTMIQLANAQFASKTNVNTSLLYASEMNESYQLIQSLKSVSD